MILFTMAGNILPAYVLPGIPALGILVAMLVDKNDFKWVTGTAAVLPVLLMIAMLVLNMGKADSRSDRIIFEQIDDSAPVFYIGKRPFSGQFYSHGQAKKLEDANDLTNLKKFHLIGKSQQVDVVIHDNALSCTNDFTAKSKRSLYTCVMG